MKREHGFTLIELLLVLVIIGILASAVTISVAGRGRQARETRAKADLVIYQQQIEAFAMEHNDQYPNSLNDLVGGERDYVTEVRPDPWGQPYVYKKPGKKHDYDLYSKGRDGQAGTADDISFWDE